MQVFEKARRLLAIAEAAECEDKLFKLAESHGIEKEALLWLATPPQETVEKLDEISEEFLDELDALRLCVYCKGVGVDHLGHKCRICKGRGVNEANAK